MSGIRGMGRESERSEARRRFEQDNQPVDAIALAMKLPIDTVRQHIFGKPRAPLARSSSPRKRQAISPASQPQRDKVKFALSITGEEGYCDPAHIWPRSLGGCDDPLCVVPLLRTEHDLFDEGKLNLLPYLTQRFPDELAHALQHANGDVIALLERVTGEKWISTSDHVAVARAMRAVREAA